MKFNLRRIGLLSVTVIVSAAIVQTAAIRLPSSVLALSTAEVGKIAKQITVLIDGQNPGSGVIIKHEGNTYTVLTAAHVVATEDEYTIVTPDGGRYKLNYGTVKKLPEVDLAVVQFTSTRAYTVATIDKYNQAKEGTAVYVAGFPIATAAITRSIYSFSEGKITANASQPLKDGYALVYSNNTLPGMSGGPVLNDKGELVGIHGRADTTQSEASQVNSNIAVKTGFNLGIPIHAFLSLPSQVGVNIAVSLNPNSADWKAFVAYYKQGDANYKVGDYEGAIDNYDRALKLNPKDARVSLNRGNALYEVAQHSSDPDRTYHRAIEDFNRSLGLNPNQAEAFLSRGMVRYEIAQYSKSPEKEYQQAIQDFDRALSLNPIAAKALVKRGIVRYKLAQYKGDLTTGYKAAIEDFNQALAINLQEAEAYLKRGIVRYELAQYSGQSDREAVEDLQTAAKLFLKQGDIEEYQLALGNICVALDKNCDSFLRNPEKFILSTPQNLLGDGNSE